MCIIVNCCWRVHLCVLPGCRDVVLGRILKKMFETPYFRCVVVPDADTVEICGALKVDQCDMHCCLYTVYVDNTIVLSVSSDMNDIKLQSSADFLVHWTRNNAATVNSKILPIWHHGLIKNCPKTLSKPKMFKVIVYIETVNKSGLERLHILLWYNHTKILWEIKCPKPPCIICCHLLDCPIVKWFYSLYIHTSIYLANTSDCRWDFIPHCIPYLRSVRLF